MFINYFCGPVKFKIYHSLLPSLFLCRLWKQNSLWNVFWMCKLNEMQSLSWSHYTGTLIQFILILLTSVTHTALFQILSHLLHVVCFPFTTSGGAGPCCGTALSFSVCWKILCSFCCFRSLVTCTHFCELLIRNYFPDTWPLVHIFTDGHWNLPLLDQLM